VLTLQEISDRLEIQDLLARYSDAIDRHDLEALDTLFTEDAVVDYSEFGGPRGSLATVKEFLAKCSHCTPATTTWWARRSSR
jgi:ketosteroid isomerase-like protein